MAATEEEVEAIIRAFLAGVARGAAEQFPTPEQAGESIGRRVTRGRSKGDPLKKVRKVSAYSKEYGRQYKRLKAKHPRMSFGALSKKAHAATRKAMK